MRAIVLLVAVSLVGLGCSENEPPANFPDEPEDAPGDLVLHTEGGTVDVRLRERGLVLPEMDLVGPEVNLGRYREAEAGAMRGKAFGRPVSLDIGAGRVKGLVGPQPVDVAVSREGKTLRITGLVRGVPSDFRIDPAVVKGTLGRCSYDLARSGVAYVGRVSCGHGLSSARLHVPYSLTCWDGDLDGVFYECARSFAVRDQWCWSDAERAAAFAVVLGG